MYWFTIKAIISKFPNHKKLKNLLNILDRLIIILVKLQEFYPANFRILKIIATRYICLAPLIHVKHLDSELIKLQFIIALTNLGSD